MFMQSHILLLPNCCLNILLYSCCLQRKKQNIDLLLQSFKINNDYYNPSPPATPNPETSSTQNDGDSLSPETKMFLQSRYKNFHAVIPAEYTFDTIDKSRAVLSKHDVIDKLDYSIGDEKEIEILNQVKNICDMALDSEWSYDQTMNEIDLLLFQYF